jgi:Ser/Thr protein kinase RdoA (MazF antagonist)
MSLQRAPRFDLDGAAHVLYRLEASVSPLPSERDQNFLLTADAGGR